MDKTINQKAWFLVLPVFLVVAFSAILPLMTVVNYSMQDTFGNNQFFWNGVGWFKELLDPSTDLGSRFFASLWRNLFFSAVILAIEVPLGIVVALSMPREGWRVAACLVILALPLLIPWNVVGTIWQIFGRPDIGLLGYVLNNIGINYNYVSNEFDAWATVIVMDVWHWTSLVALLCYAGLKSIPDAYYQAAQIDGASRWAVFTAIQLPKMNRVLLIAVLLRFMDSFMIYTEPFVVTGGGPGNSTTFISIELVKIALGQFDLGKAAALSLVYNLIIIIVCWIFYTVMTNAGAERPAEPRESHDAFDPRTPHHHFAVPDLPAAADLLAGQHELQDQRGDRLDHDAVAASADHRQLHAHLHRRELVFRLHQLAEICGHQYRDLDFGGVAGGLRVFALSLPRRQASVLLAAVEPDGAGGGLCAAVLQSVFGDQPVRYALGGGTGALHLQRAAGGVDPRRLRVRRAARDRRDGVPRRLLVPAILHQDPGAADRERHRRRRVLLLHVFLGRIAAGAHADVGRTPSRSPP